MTIERLDGMMLATRPAGDSGAWVTFFTAQKGVVNVYCRLSKSSKKNTPIEPFIPFWLSCTQKNQRFFLIQAEPSGPFMTLTGLQLFAGLYVNELLYVLLLEGDPCHELYHDWCTALAHLQYGADNLSIAKILRQFESALLRHLGYEISFAFDHHGALIEGELRYQYRPGEGFVRHTEGYLGRDLLVLAEGVTLENRHWVIAKRVYQAALNHLHNKELQAQKLLKAYLHSI